MCGAGLGPKIALPTLTIVAPSSTAVSKSWLIPIDRTLNASGRPPRSYSNSARIAAK